MDTNKQKLDKVVGLAVIIAFLLLAGSNPIRTLEWTAYSWGVQITPERSPDTSIAVIAIDDASLKAYGDWPWDRSRIAEMVKKLNRSSVAVIGLDLPLHEKQNQLGINTLRSLSKSPRYRSNEQTWQLISQTIRRLNTDQTLASVLKASDNTIISVPYDPTRRRPETEIIDQSLANSLLKSVQGQAPPAYSEIPEWLHPDHAIYIEKAYTPLSNVANSAQALGLGLSTRDIDGSIYGRPAITPIGTEYLPSFPLLVAAAKTYNLDQITVLHGAGVAFGDRLIPTNSKFRSFPFYYKSKDNLPPFPVYSFKKVMDGDIRSEVFNNRAVLIGLTSERFITPVKTPLGNALAPVLVEAHTVSSYLQDHWYSSPAWVHWVRYFIFGLIGVYLMFLLPRLGFGTGFAITALVLVVMFNTHFVLMALANIWLPLMAPAAALACGHLLFGTRRILLNRAERFQSELAKANRLLGQAFQMQGQLDQAFERYRSCEIDEELLSLTYNLGLDYERKRQFNKAANIFRFIRTHKPAYRDAKDRIHKNLQTSNAVVLKGGSSQNDSDGTLLLGKNGMQRPMLGRYEIESEIGRGAMGIVYLGSDPKIDRTVAIKTMPLSSEFEEDQLDEVKQRFFREAKTAGKLNHNNIVTIYDVGEEQDLAYIAMDYLQGVDMSKFTKKDKLIKVSEVFHVIIQVADALNYAHSQNVVHRDIKPANILYDRRNRKPTLTDFGVAHLTDTSKTKTGMILGTPSFMSPEQLAGRQIDGRSDIFSLGVTFFQLLTGELPFVGESISSLMYKITNDAPRDIVKLRPALPICVKAVISKALQKDPEKRYQTGEEFATAIKRCQQQIAAQQGNLTGQRKKIPSL